MHYYKRNLGDYAKKAGRLTMLQHGSYTLLIDACYDREKFPTMDEAIEWAWASTPDEVQAVQFVLSKFFTLENGVYVQKRIAEELAEYAEFCADQKRKGLLGGRPKNPTGLINNPTGLENNPTVTQVKPDESLTTNHKPLTTNHDPLTTNQEPEVQNQTKSKPLKPASPVSTKKELSADETALQTACKETWRAYSREYQNRYKVEPIRNALVNSQIKGFCGRVAHNEAPHIAGFYVWHNQSFYVTQMHPTSLLLKNAEKLRTEWATNTKATTSQARLADQTQGMGQIWDKLKREAQENERTIHQNN